jgi:pyruvate dehydrogenase E1 component alpha subunit
LATADELKSIDKEIQAIVDDSVEFAEASPDPDPSELRRYIFAED